jgi:hypothetical protein
VWGLMDARSSSHAMDRDIKETHSRVGIVLFSNVNSYSFRTVRIFNIISLHFRERGEIKLTSLHCYVGSLASEPGHRSNGQTTLARSTVILSSNGLGDVISVHCYCDQLGPIVSDLK